ncbi:hypothetical protein [Nocardia wallacei]|uniref:hypothetical protein n=1 Tax=Nocardia wallacei TaxID=480035 RepID=UPI0024548320|nr:hypothetical protein [Nocardia wallacei]
MPESVRRNAYGWWTDERNAELVDMLLAGKTEQQIADKTGRSVTAIRTRCRNLLPPDLVSRDSTAVERLRELLRLPGYDWRDPLRERQRRARQIYWDQALNDILADGWERARTCQDLSAATGASEVEVARQLMRLGLAENSRDVATRLGCDPNGTLAGRVRLMEDRAAAAVWVLIIDGARAAKEVARPSDLGGSFPRHVSVHIDYDDADLTLNQLVLDHVDAGGDIDELTAHIAERTVGDLAAGVDRAIAAPPIPLDDLPPFWTPSTASDTTDTVPSTGQRPPTAPGHRLRRLLRRRVNSS